MSSNVAEISIEAPLTSNPLDVIPNEIPVSYTHLDVYKRQGYSSSKE